MPGFRPTAFSGPPCVTVSSSSRTAALPWEPNSPPQCLLCFRHQGFRPESKSEDREGAQTEQKVPHRKAAVFPLNGRMPAYSGTRLRKKKRHWERSSGSTSHLIDGNSGLAVPVGRRRHQPALGEADIRSPRHTGTPSSTRHGRPDNRDATSGANSQHASSRPAAWLLDTSPRTI